MKHTSRKILSLLLVLSMVVGLFAVAAVAAPAADNHAEVYDLRVEDLIAPVGIDNANPVFSWKMSADAIGARQTAYSITVTSEAGETVWNTGWTEGDDSVGIAYAGSALQPATEYTVVVAIKDENGRETAPATTTFETGLMSETPLADANWIRIGEKEGSGRNATVYTIDFDFVINSDNQGFCFGMQDTGTFVMWQVNSYDGPNNNQGGDIVLLRPHFKKDDSWMAYPGFGSVNAVNITDAVGYKASEIAGKQIHERIEINGTTIKTWFGPDSEKLTLADTYTHSETIPLGSVGFRQNNDSGASEIASFDNIVVRGADGTVLYSNDFSDPGNPGFTKTTGYLAVLDGWLQVGSDQPIGEQIYIESSVAVNNNLPAYRKSFTPEKALKSAKLYTSGLGVYESYINGERVGRKMDDGSVQYDELKPGFTEMKLRKFYSTYDVTWMLNTGEENVLAAVVSSGWWSGRVAARAGKNTAYLAKLVLTYEDGTSETIVTDTSWKSFKASALQEGTGIFEGERYDARVDQSWMLPGYDDSEWFDAKLNKEYTGKISAWSGVPITVRQDLERTPQSITVYQGATGAASGQYGKINVVRTYENGEEITLNPGETLLVDFGQNFSGWEAFDVTTESGNVITVEHGEMLNDGNGATNRGNDGPEGSVYNANYRSSTANTLYTASGAENESYHPSHSFYGFRYIEITADQPATFRNITGQVVTSSQEDTGFMTTSDADVNQLISNVRWGMYSNYLSVPTDCPQRDERQGWTGDTQAFSLTGCYMGNSKSFLEKWMMDMRDIQYTGTKGAYPGSAPTGSVGGATWGAIGWADAGIIVPYHLYVMYGDVSVVNENWASMKWYMDVYMAETNKLGGNHAYGDWLSYESNDDAIKDMLGVSYYAWDAQMMVTMAKAIGDEEAAARYQAVYEEEKAFYQSCYVNEDGTLKRSEQTPCLYALYLDLLPNEKSVAAVTEQLISNIERNGNKLQTGFLGTEIIMHTLTKIGRTDVAYKLLLQHDNPSWLYSVDQGATTIWERWNSYTLANGFGDVNMNSFNHYSYGAVAAWMFHGMAGIGYDVEDPGFKHIVLAPQPDQQLKSVEAAYQSAYGEIVSNMHYEGTTWNYACTVPANTTATIKLPVEKIDTLTVNGHTVSALTKDEGLSYVGYENGIATFEAVAGSFTFASEVDVINYVKLNLNAPADMPLATANICVNGETKAYALPVTLDVKSGDVITGTVAPLNYVDYAVSSWTAADGEVICNGAELNYTVNNDTEITANVTWCGLQSLAIGKPVTASQVNDDWKASNLTDGVLNYLGGTNGWSSAYIGTSTTFDATSAVIDLEETTTFNRFHLYPRNLPSQREDVGVMNCPKAYTIYISDDNSSWTPVYTTANGDQINAYVPIVIELEEAVSARYVKFECTAVHHSDEAGWVYVQLSEFGIYMVEEEAKNVVLTVNGKEEASISDESVSFTVSAENMNRLASMILTIQLDQETLADVTAAGLNGWQVLVQTWEDGILTVKAVNLEGSAGAGEILRITAKPTGKIGVANLRITNAVMAAYVDETEDFVEADLTTAFATTNVTFNKYDVNRDGIVDILDITRAQRYYGTANAICDVNEDGAVDINDLVLILNNFTEEM